MATAKKPALLFNGKPISEAQANELIVAIYGEKRVDEIYAGLVNGTYQCASVAGGYLVLDKSAAQPK